MLPWPLIAAEFHGVSSHTASIKTTRNGVYVHSKEASVCRTVLRISSDSYSGLAMQEPVQRKRSGLIIASKVSSSRNTEKYVIPLDIERLGMPTSFVAVRNILASLIEAEVILPSAWLV
jgi:hypothetical protein